jgi:hypothetical protein
MAQDIACGRATATAIEDVVASALLFADAIAVAWTPIDQTMPESMIHRRTTALRSIANHGYPARDTSTAQLVEIVDWMVDNARQGLGEDVEPKPL